MTDERNSKISLYLPGGGTSALWQVGAIAALLEEGAEIEHLVVSSAGSIGAVFLAAAKLYQVEHRPDLSLAECYMHSARQLSHLSHGGLISWEKMFVQLKLAWQELNSFNIAIWDSDKLSAEFGNILYSHSLGRQLSISDLRNLGLKITVLLTEVSPTDSPEKPYKYLPTMFPLFGDPQNDQPVLVSEIPSIAMSLPGILPKANSLLERLNFPLTPGCDYIDGDFGVDAYQFNDMEQSELTRITTDWMKVVAESESKLLCLETGVPQNIVVERFLSRFIGQAAINRNFGDIGITKLQLMPLESIPLRMSNIEASITYGYDYMQKWLIESKFLSNEQNLEMKIK